MIIYSYIEDLEKIIKRLYDGESLHEMLGGNVSQNEWLFEWRAKRDGYWKKWIANNDAESNFDFEI